MVDLGGQWVHGETGNVVFEMASKHNLLGLFSNWLDPGKHNFVTGNGEMIPKDESNEAVMTYFNLTEVKEEMEKEIGSVGDFFVRE